jgi:hypothetical protein
MTDPPTSDTTMTTTEQQAQAIADLDTRTDRQEQRTYPPKPTPEQRAEYQRILTQRPPP